MDSDRISTTEDWLTTHSVQDVQVLLGFMNFHKEFIRKSAKVTIPISDLLKIAGTSRTPEQVKLEWTRDAERAFGKLKRTFTNASLLNHSNLAMQIILQTYARGLAIAGIPNKYDGFGILRLVNFYYRRCTGAEQTYDGYDRALLAIVVTQKQLCHSIEGPNDNVLKNASIRTSNSSKCQKSYPGCRLKGQISSLHTTSLSNTWNARSTQLADL